MCLQINVLRDGFLSSTAIAPIAIIEQLSILQEAARTLLELFAPKPWPIIQILRVCAFFEEE